MMVLVAPGECLLLQNKDYKSLQKIIIKELSIHLYGQEINPETYAITKADMLLKGRCDYKRKILAYGSTLSNDGFPTNNFDFMLSNPPYGKAGRPIRHRLGGKGDITDYTLF